MKKITVEKLRSIFWTAGYLIQYQWLRLRCSVGKFNLHRSSNRKHLLILAWWFPPTISGGVYRPLSFARYANARGWKVTVLCFSEPNPPSEAGKYLLEQLPGEVEVIRINNNSRPLSYNYFPKVDGGFANAIDSINLILEKRIHPSILLASGPPFHNFITGYYLSKYFNSPLIVDYRDEWTLCPFEFVHTSSFDAYWEPRCLSKAKAVLFTTNSQKTEAASRFTEVDHEKFIVLPNGIELDDLKDTQQPNPARNKSKEIAYFGFLGTHTPPDLFIHTLETVFARRPDLKQRFDIRFIGGQSKEIAEQLTSSALQENIKLSGQLSKKDAINMMRNCTALLIINPAPLSRYIPGKLFDYLASEAPILVFGKGGEAAHIVGALEAGIVVPDNSPDQLELALDKLSNWQYKNNSHEIQKWISDHSRENIANKLIDLLDDIQATSAINI